MTGDDGFVDLVILISRMLGLVFVYLHVGLRRSSVNFFKYSSDSLPEGI